jgi:putative MATE family efflux protein
VRRRLHGNLETSVAYPARMPDPSPPVSEDAASFRSEVRDALRGAQHDYTRLPMRRAVLLLAIPMVLEMAMESVFALTDAFFVSRLGTDALATVGLTESMITLVFAVAIGSGMATTAMVSRRIGEGNVTGARVAAGQSILLGLAIALLLGVPGATLAPELLRFMGGSEALVASGHGYTRVLFGGSFTIMLLFLLNAVFRGAGDAAVAMRVLWIANACNIVLDPLLIFGVGPFPELGVAGAAVATTAGRGVGVVLQLVILLRGGSRIRIRPVDLIPRPHVLTRLVRLSVGGVLQFLIGTASWVALVWIVGRFGAAPVAGYTLAIRLVIFAILPSWGLANAAATLVGQNLGADRPDRAEAAVWLTGRWNMWFLLAVAVVFLGAADPLLTVFTSEPDVLAQGAACLRLVVLGYPFYAWGMVLVQAFNGAGDTYTPTAINLVCYWGLQIPLAWALAHHTALDAVGVYIAITAAESLVAVVALLVFRRGRWKSRIV